MYLIHDNAYRIHWTLSARSELKSGMANHIGIALDVSIEACEELLGDNIEFS